MNGYKYLVEAFQKRSILILMIHCKLVQCPLTDMVKLAHVRYIVSKKCFTPLKVTLAPYVYNTLTPLYLTRSMLLTSVAQRTLKALDGPLVYAVWGT